MRCYLKSTGFILLTLRFIIFQRLGARADHVGGGAVATRVQAAVTPHITDRQERAAANIGEWQVPAGQV